MASSALGKSDVKHYTYSARDYHMMYDREYKPASTVCSCLNIIEDWPSDGEASAACEQLCDVLENLEYSVLDMGYIKIETAVQNIATIEKLHKCIREMAFELQMKIAKPVITK